MSYATAAHLEQRLPGKQIGAEVAADLLAESSAEINQEIETAGWHTLPLNLAAPAKDSEEPDDAAAARVILRALCLELTVQRFLRLQHGRANTGADETSAQVEADRLLFRLHLPLPGLPRREPLDSMAHLYDLAAAPAAVVTEVNRRLRAYREQRPRVLASTALEATGCGELLRTFLKATPVEL